MTSLAKPTLLRVLRYDTPEPDQHVLLHLLPTSPTHPLNLQIHATEGERAFAVTLHQSEISKLRVMSYTGTAEELEGILSAVLLKRNGSGVARGIELAAGVDDKGVVLTVRQDIGGIKQRIAALQIPEEEVEIPIFEWAAEACGALEGAFTQLESLQDKVSTQEKELEQMMAQVKDMVAFKKEHEEMLLVKFSELLNSKKAKIRELSRELEVFRIGDDGPSRASPVREPEAVEPGPSVTRTRAGRGRAKPTAANVRKRKPVAPPSDSESDGGFTKMDVDPKGKSSKEVGNDDEDETEDEDGGGGAGYIRQEVRSDRSVTEDEDELPPVRKPFAFTTRAPDKSPERATERERVEDEAPAKSAGRGRGRGRGKGKASGATASPPAARGRGRGRTTRAKPRDPTPSPPPSHDGAGDTADSEDDEL